MADADGTMLKKAQLKKLMKLLTTPARAARMGLNTNTLNFNIQPLQGCNLLVHFNHRWPPVVTHCSTPAGVNTELNTQKSIII